MSGRALGMQTAFGAVVLVAKEKNWSPCQRGAGPRALAVLDTYALPARQDDGSSRQVLKELEGEVDEVSVAPVVYPPSSSEEGE